MELLHHLHFVLLVLVVILEIEVLGKLVFRVEQLRHEEVQETPQFTDIILEWRTS